MKSEKAAGKEFDRWTAEGRAERMAKGHVELVEWIFARWRREFPKQVRGGAILDIGCGVGDALKRSKAVGFQGYFGVDVSERMIEHARAYFPEAQFQIAGGGNLPFEDASFDAVISIESLYYHPDPVETLKEVRRVLKPNGVFGSAIELFQENPVGVLWSDLLEIEVHNLSEKTWLEHLQAGGLHSVNAQRIPRVLEKTESEFEPSKHFPSYELYREYTKQGALYLEAKGVLR